MFAFIKQKNFFVIIGLCLICCASACNSVGGDGDDYFKTVNFNPEPRGAQLAAKKFNFNVGGTTVNVTGADCIAITWDGSLKNLGNVFGFAVRTDDNTFSLIVYFEKSGSGSFSGSRTLEAGEYTAILRYNDKVYSQPSSPLSITVARDSSQQTSITMNQPLIFTSPSSITVTPAGAMVLRSY